MNLRRLSSPILRRAWIPYFILFFTLVLSLLTTYFVAQETRENDQLRFKNLVERTQGTIENQLNTYITLLEGASGLHAASDLVTKDEFNTYVNRLHLRRNYPGIQGLGYLLKVPAAEKDAVTDLVRSEGTTDFRIWPEQGQQIYYPILYLEPLDERNSVAIGYDMYTEPVRREAMNRAIVTGRPAMSGKVTLVQEIDANKQAGFLVYLPLYTDGIIPQTLTEKQENLDGFVYAPFRGDDLLSGILRGENSPQIDFRVYDGQANAANLLHDSRNFAAKREPDYKPRYKMTESLRIAGRTWTIEYTTNPAFDAVSETWIIPLALVLGILVSGILFLLSKSQYEAGRKAEISELNLQFIAEAGKILASSLNFKRTIATVAALGVPEVADWCSVQLRKGNSIETLVISHKDEKKVALARNYLRKHPPSLKSASGSGKVIRTGEKEFYPLITETMLRASVSDPETFALLKKIGFASLIIVPLKLHRRTFGAMTFVSSDPKRLFTGSDLSMAEEIAQRAAMAIEHARLFSETEKAVEMRDEFISVASHELKTPVTSLKMYLQVLHRQLLRKGEDTLSEAVVKMDSQVDKLTLLISDLLNVSRIQHGRLEYHDESFNLTEVVADIVEQVQQTEKDHTILIKGTITRKVFGDKDRIGQVITNLLTNALKYSPDADTVVVQLSSSTEGATVAVKDFGIGIDEKHVGKLFDRFYRVSDLNRKTFPGLGIGLFISQEIIKRHEGTMSVTSRKGDGSTFSFTLPFKTKNNSTNKH